MGLMQRVKGKRFERQVAADLRALWPSADIHRSSQAERARNPDVMIEGNAPDLAKRLWLELQDARWPTPLAKLEQAERDVAALPKNHRPWLAPWPVVVWHKLGSRSIQATMRIWSLASIVGNATPWQDHASVVVTMDWADFKATLSTAVEVETHEKGAA